MSLFAVYFCPKMHFKNRTQCDLIGPFNKYLGYNFYKSSPNIILGLLKNATFKLKTAVSTFTQLLAKA